VAAPTIVYTDGACSGNPGPGGWAWAVPDGPFASGAEPKTTNQRMELTAALDAVRSIGGPLEVVSDSTYLVNCFRDRWWEGWIARGWLTSQRKPVVSRDLWEPLVEEVRRRRIAFRWVKGHSGDRWNDLVDRLAVEAAASQRGRRGAAPPTEVAEAELPGPGSTVAADREIEGHTLLVVGHRPPELGGYGETVTSRRVRDRLRAVVEAKRILHPDLVVVTGLSLGVETLAAEAAREAGADYVVVLAHPGQEAVWPGEAKRRFAELREAARDVITLQRHAPGTKPRMAASFARRDAWLRRNADEAIAVWDGRDDSLGKVVRSLREALDEEDVWVIDPAELG
jgi:ribonuclease HI/uncharacterized phage-like protein YoqJ